MLDRRLKKGLKNMKMEFDRTAQTLLHLSKQMSDVHEMYPGKEHQKIRERNYYSLTGNVVKSCTMKGLG